MVKNVNRTARLQWKVDTIKNCIYLQCVANKALSKQEGTIVCSQQTFVPSFLSGL